MTLKARDGVCGVVFACGEAQNPADRAEKEPYLLSLLLDIFQSMQKTTFMLLLTGLPKLVEA